MMETIEYKGMPKNTRQIGEPGNGIKILVEDYAYTYLCQLAREQLTCMTTVILAGRITEGQTVCVCGVLRLDMGQESKEWFSGEHWRTIFEQMKQWFSDLEVVGWGLLNPGFPPILTEEWAALHRRHFQTAHSLFFQMDILDHEEIFYVKEAAGLVPRNGYYIYYEKNDAMQSYMSNQRGGAGIEPEGMMRDQAAMKFRTMMQEKKEHHLQKKAMAFLCTACTFLVMVILVIGVTMLNNYDRMTQMEHAIYELSENLEQPEKANTGEPEETERLVEAVQTENQLAAEQEEPMEPEPEKLPEQEESEAESQSVMSEQPEAVYEPEQYEVQQGDTLLGISRRKYGTDEMVKKICEANDLEDSDKIYVGQTIVLP